MTGISKFGVIRRIWIRWWCCIPVGAFWAFIYRFTVNRDCGKLWLVSDHVRWRSQALTALAVSNSSFARRVTELLILFYSIFVILQSFDIPFASLPNNTMTCNIHVLLLLLEIHIYTSFEKTRMKNFWTTKDSGVGWWYIISIFFILGPFASSTSSSFFLHHHHHHPAAAAVQPDSELVSGIPMPNDDKKKICYSQFSIREGEIADYSTFTASRSAPVSSLILLPPLKEIKVGI